MDTTTKAIIGSVIALLLISVTLVGIVVVDVEQMPTVGGESAPETPAEQDISKYVKESEPGAADLKRAFSSDYQYDSYVGMKDDGTVGLMYTSDAQNGNQLKDEMKNIALLYADVAAENPDMGSLVIHSNRITLAVPVNSAIAHGNGTIDEEAYFKTVRWESTESTSS